MVLTERSAALNAVDRSWFKVKYMPHESTQIKWCDDDGRRVYADTSHVTSTREEIALLFGVSQMPPTGTGQMRVQIKERVVLSPRVAKQLAALLNQAVAGYEIQTDPNRDGIANSPGIGSRTAPGDEDPTTPSAQVPGTAADQLLQHLKDLNLEYGFERSFKVTDGTLLDNRYLLGFRKDAIRSDADQKIMDICQQLSMPADYIDTFIARLPEADYIHFGSEEGENARIHKVYLEFRDAIRQKVKSQVAPIQKHLLHLGFKWDAADNARHALTHYTWIPALTVEKMQARLAKILDSDKHQSLLEIVTGIIELAAKQIDFRDFLFLEVTEEENPRLSFDINMYRANLQISELKPILEAIFRHYALPMDKFRRLYDRTRTKTFGHVSGGIDRQGRDFLTIYYGVTGSSIDVRNPVQGQSRQAAPSLSRKTDEQAQFLIDRVKDLKVQVGFERSFKFLPGTILTNRFLIGLMRNRLKDQGDERILAICRQINMPADYMQAIRAQLPEATIVLFGYERKGQNVLYKAYLEFGGRLEMAHQTALDQPQPFVLHKGFKWDANDNSRRALARYTCYPAIGIEAMLERLARVYSGPEQQMHFKTTAEIIQMAAGRMPPSDMLYLEANEEDNPRKSYDLNMYPANFRMQALYQYLSNMGHLCSISEAYFQSLYAHVRQNKFGHLAGGVDREGRDFFTVYFRD